MKTSRFCDLREFNTSEGTMKPLFVSRELKVIHLTVPAGLSVTPHSHPTPGNIFIIRGSVHLNSENEVVLEKGDLAHIPADYTVGLESEEGAEALLISSPSGFQSIEEFYTRLEGICG